MGGVRCAGSGRASADRRRGQPTGAGKRRAAPAGGRAERGMKWVEGGGGARPAQGRANPAQGLARLYLPSPGCPGPPRPPPPRLLGQRTVPDPRAMPGPGVPRGQDAVPGLQLRPSWALPNSPLHPRVGPFPTAPSGIKTKILQLQAAQRYTNACLKWKGDKSKLSCRCGGTPCLIFPP